MKRFAKFAAKEAAKTAANYAVDKIIDEDELCEEETKNSRYAPVGKRIVIGENGVRTTVQESTDDDRCKYIISQLTNGDDDGYSFVDFLNYAHCKECKDADGKCQGRYQIGVGNSACRA